MIWFLVFPNSGPGSSCARQIMLMRLMNFRNLFFVSPFGQGLRRNAPMYDNLRAPSRRITLILLFLLLKDMIPPSVDRPGFGSRLLVSLEALLLQIWISSWSTNGRWKLHRGWFVKGPYGSREKRHNSCSSGKSHYNLRICVVPLGILAISRTVAIYSRHS